MNFEVIITPEFQIAVERQAAPIMERFLTETSARIDEKFHEPKSGREYQISRGVRYRASAAGEPPARRTGALQASISEPQISKSGNALIGTLTISAPYALGLERGTPRIKPRPFAMPAVEEILRRWA